MKIFASVKSFTHFENIVNSVDGIVIGNNNYSSLLSASFEVEDLIKIISKSTELNKEVVINISSMQTNSSMILLEDFIKNFVNFDVLYMYSDLGVYNLLKKYNIHNKGIYDPSTMITNSMDMNFYLSKGMEACSLSLEIPLKDIKSLNDKKIGKLWYKVFGYHQMFHSKRKLISTYGKFLNKKIEINNENSYLIEETRNQKYPIIENDHGTILLRNYIVSMLKEVDRIKEIDYLYLDSNLIDEEVFNKVLEIYIDVLHNTIELEDGLNKIADLKLNIEDGFMYQDTVYQKEELK